MHDYFDTPVTSSTTAGPVLSAVSGPQQYQNLPQQFAVSSPGADMHHHSNLYHRPSASTFSSSSSVASGISYLSIGGSSTSGSSTPAETPTASSSLRLLNLDPPKTSATSSAGMFPLLSADPRVASPSSSLSAPIQPRRVSSSSSIQNQQALSFLGRAHSSPQILRSLNPASPVSATTSTPPLSTSSVTATSSSTTTQMRTPERRVSASSIFNSRGKIKRQSPTNFADESTPPVGATQVDHLMLIVQAREKLRKKSEDGAVSSSSSVVGSDSVVNSGVATGFYGFETDAGDGSVSASTTGNNELQIKAETGEAPKEELGRSSRGLKHPCLYAGCGKVFNQKTHLDIHGRSHTGSRPYVCDVPNCGKRFSQRGNLRVRLLFFMVKFFLLFLSAMMLIMKSRLTSEVILVKSHMYASCVIRDLHNGETCVRIF